MYNIINKYIHKYIYIYIERERQRERERYRYDIREMGGAPRNQAPRNHLLVRIVKPSGCHCTDGHLTSSVSLRTRICCRLPTPLRSTSPLSEISRPLTAREGDLAQTRRRGSGSGRQAPTPDGRTDKDANYARALDEQDVALFAGCRASSGRLLARWTPQLRPGSATRHSAPDPVPYPLPCPGKGYRKRPSRVA